ncbi:MAG: PPOX class F420-dependent oxidoreductase [Terriglobales bacterium]
MAEQGFSYLQGRAYIDLVTFRRTGAPVHTPVWFAERDGKLYVMTRSDSGKMKRIRNNSRVEVAPCTMRGKVVGPAVAATARLADDQVAARQAIRRKYWTARIPWVWSRNNVYLEIAPL